MAPNVDFEQIAKTLLTIDGQWPCSAFSRIPSFLGCSPI